jgi:hypothetical protein
VANFTRLYKKYLLKHNLPTKIKCLKQRTKYPITALDKFTYEEVDALRCKGAALSERKCRKLRMGQVAFSPQLQEASQKIYAWSLLERKAKGLKTSSCLLSRALRKASIPKAARMYPLEEICSNIKLAYKEYYAVKGNDKATRATAQETLAEALAEEGNTTKEKMLKVIRHREKQRTTARKIKFLRGKLKAGSTTMVTVQLSDGSSQDITGKQAIEEAILKNNQEKYQQSFHTPFLQSPLREAFGFKGLSSAAQAVLGGVYEPPENVDRYTKAFIKELCMPQKVREMGKQTMEISLEEYKHFWKKANDKISCYPAELSFATMKAGSYDDLIAEIECDLLNFVLASGYSPERWKKLLDVMILKKSGITQLSSLRTICLFPVDCNYAFKHIGREMMKIAEATGSLAPEQYGSRKGHRSIDLAVSKALTYDLFRQLQCTGAICFNDARSCYDLIGHSQASIAMQRNGVPRSTVDCLFSTLQNAKHQVRTGYGDSSKSYGGDAWITPMHGIGQGNGAGPAIWAVLSTPLLNMLRSVGVGCDFVSPLSKDKTSFVGYAFVDDTDVIVSNYAMTDSLQALTTLQRAVDTWEGGLKSTCGAIVPEKTFWYLIDFKWSSGK